MNQHKRESRSASSAGEGPVVEFCRLVVAAWSLQERLPDDLRSKVDIPLNELHSRSLRGGVDLLNPETVEDVRQLNSIFHGYGLVSLLESALSLKRDDGLSESLIDHWRYVLWDDEARIVESILSDRKVQDAYDLIKWLKQNVTLETTSDSSFA